MGGDTVSVSFSMDDGPTHAIDYVLRPQSEYHTPSKPRAEDEMQFYHGSLEGHGRLQVSSATLQPVNLNGVPLSQQEHDISRLVITLCRGYQSATTDPVTGGSRYHFVPATGPAGFPSNVVFYYCTSYTSTC